MNHASSHLLVEIGDGALTKTEGNSKVSELEKNVRWLTPREVAGRLKISLSLVYKLCKEWRLKHYRFGGTGKRGNIRIEESEVHRFIGECYRVDDMQKIQLSSLTHLNLK